MQAMFAGMIEILILAPERYEDRAFLFVTLEADGWV
jgi:hypothetical protein